MTNISIRFYTVPRDAFEAGDCPMCARCGSTMRHVTEINGATYGSGCGKIVLASLEAVSRQVDQLVKEAAQVIPAATVAFYEPGYGWTADYIQQRAFNCREAGKIELARAWEKLFSARYKQKVTPVFWGNWKLAR